MKNLLAHADNSADLRAHLENGKKLISTTIQKSPFIIDGIGGMSDKKFAVIIDEAHSSQSGQAADKLESLIGDAINKERRRELELYKLYASDSEFKKALNESLIRILAIQEQKKSA